MEFIVFKINCGFCDDGMFDLPAIKEKCYECSGQSHLIVELNLSTKKLLVNSKNKEIKRLVNKYPVETITKYIETCYIDNHYELLNSLIKFLFDNNILNNYDFSYMYEHMSKKSLNLINNSSKASKFNL